MSLKSVSVPKYRHHKGSGQAFVQVNGHRHYLGKWDSPKSKERYSAFVAELAVSPIAAATLPLATPVPKLTVVELCAAYLDFADGYYRRNGQPTRTIQGIRAAIRAIKSLYGETPVDDFSPIGLLAIQTSLAGGALSRNYANKILGYIKRMFKWGVCRAIVPPTVYTALSTVEGLRMGRTSAKESKPVLPVSDELVDATLPYLPAVVADMVRFQRLTGARPGEVCQIRPCDVDRSGEVWEYRPQSHKMEHHGRQRVIYIGPKAQAILSPYLLRAQDAHCFSPTESVRKREIEMRASRKTRVQPSQQCRRKRKPMVLRVLRTPKLLPSHYQGHHPGQ
jgi:integrase